MNKTPLFDYQSRQHIIKNKNVVFASDIENIKNWISKVLLTQLNKYDIYTVDETEDFGLSIYNNIQNRTLSDGYLFSETKRQINEQIPKHYFIESISDLTFKRECKKLEISFNVLLKDNSIINYKGVVK